MKKSYFIIALATFAALSVSSCKNNNKKTTVAAPEQVQQQKAALADSVLAQIDLIAEEYFDATSKCFRLRNIELTEKEKMVKPDYLLDLSAANTLVTKTQKVNALAYYIIEYGLRKAYDMPLEEAKATILKLASDINHPIDFDLANYETQIRQVYRDCKEKEELTYFWQFQHAIIAEFTYITSRNPELFFSKISQQQRQSFADRVDSYIKAMKKIAQYDDEMAYAYFLFKKYRIFPTDDQMIQAYNSPESIIEFQIENKDKYAARRNALIK